MPVAPHRLFASVVAAGIAMGGCYRSHGRDARIDVGARSDAGRPYAGRDAGPDAAADAGCSTLMCERCDPRPECDWPSVCRVECIF